MAIATREDAVSLVNEIKGEEFQPCMAFTGFVNDQVHNTLIYFEEDMFKVLEINEECESEDSDKELILTDNEMVDYIMNHSEAINELLANFAKVEWQEKVKRRQHITRVK